MTWTSICFTCSVLILFYDVALSAKLKNTNKSEFQHGSREVITDHSALQTKTNRHGEAKSTRSKATDVQDGGVIRGEEWIWEMLEQAAREHSRENAKDFALLRDELLQHIDTLIQMLWNSLRHMDHIYRESRGIWSRQYSKLRDSIIKLNQASNIGYNTVLKTANFSRNLYIRAHTKQTSKPSTVLDAAKGREFSGNIELVHQEQNKVQENMKVILAMKTNVKNGEARYKQVNQLFKNTHDAEIIKDFYNNLNSAIFTINKLRRRSPTIKLLHLKQRYLNHTRALLHEAKTSLKNSLEIIDNGQKLFLETENNWKKEKKSGNLPRTETTLTKQVKSHVSHLNEDSNKLQNSLAGPIQHANNRLATLNKKDSTFVMSSYVMDLKRVIKDIDSFLDLIRATIKRKTDRKCLIIYEGSGLDESDEEDECTQESSSYDTHEGSQKPDLGQVNEDFTFGDLPDYKKVVNVSQIQLLQNDLLEYIPKFSKENERINNSGEYLLRLTAVLHQNLTVSKQKIISIVKHTALQENFLKHTTEQVKEIDEIHKRIKLVSNKIINITKYNYSDILEHAKTKLRLAKKDISENSSNTEKKIEVVQEEQSGFQINGSIKDDIILLKSKSLETCEKIRELGLNLNSMRKNITMLRSKLNRANHMLTSLRIFISNTQNSYISVPVQQRNRNVTSLVTTISICIKPTTLDGAVVTISGYNSEFYGLTLDNGKIKITTSYSSEVFGFPPLTKHQWYTIKFKLTGATVNVTLIGQDGISKHEQASFSSMSHPFQLTAVHVGGVPSTLKWNVDMWHGCLGDLLVDGELVYLYRKDANSKLPSACTEQRIADNKSISTVFGGDSYNIYRVVPENFQSISIKFKTWQIYAFLLSVVDRRMNISLSVVLTNGFLKIENYWDSETVVLQTVNNSFNNGHFHFLKIEFKDKRIYAEIQGNNKVFTSGKSSQTMFRELQVHEGIILGALLSPQKVFIRSQYRPLIGCIENLSINNKEVQLTEANDVYNSYYGYCQDSGFVNLRFSCWQWTTGSKPLTVGTLDNANRLAILVSRNAHGLVLSYSKEEEFNNIIVLKNDSIEMSSMGEDVIKNVILNPEKFKAPFSTVTLIDDGSSVIVNAWNQEMKTTYTKWYSWFSTPEKKPHTITIGDIQGKELFEGSVSQFAIEYRIFDLSLYATSHNLTTCQVPYEDVNQTDDQDVHICT
ncbi:uncharacterized protein LOC131926934 [Physella acuta]|uniref:uncharacterized protein LOC131926934 n=1 Tax=Physella acuta TaxID=109671 RepID=UPI0027DE06DD|nr:uncharacterized protein LOC131926934 [Physella acuta]